MAGITETPKANRIHIAFFGLRNAGKSTLVNAFTGQSLAIVSDVPGTTTDPVSKAMEILPLGPCLITDTAGLDDEGELGALRVRKSIDVLATADIAVWVSNPGGGDQQAARQVFLDACRKHSVVPLDFVRGDSVEELKRRIASVKIAEVVPGLLDGLVQRGDRVICVCPIDESAPKGRLILPQVQVLRECLDVGAVAIVCQPGDLRTMGEELARCNLVITDSQAFGEVKRELAGFEVRLTSFSILFARQKGDLAAYVKGIEAVRHLRDGDLVVIAEGCTHHRQCNDIGAVKIPKALKKLSGCDNLRLEFASGNSFCIPEGASLVVHCGGCMLTRREMLRRIAISSEANVPMLNYGILLAAVNGISLSSASGIVS